MEWILILLKKLDRIYRIFRIIFVPVSGGNRKHTIRFAECVCDLLHTI